jgi:hypothetical protein
VVSGPALVIFRLARIVAHLPDAEVPQAERSQRVVLLEHVTEVGEDALALQIPSYLKKKENIKCVAFLLPDERKRNDNP